MAINVIALSKNTIDIFHALFCLSKIVIGICFLKDLMLVMLTTLTLPTLVCSKCFVVCVGFPDVLKMYFY